MKKSIKSALFILLLCSQINLFGQRKKIDSLLNSFKIATQDTTRCDIYLKIGDFYMSDNPDTAFYYYNQCLKLADSKNIKKQKAKSLGDIGNLYWSQGNYDKAIEYHQSSLKI